MGELCAKHTVSLTAKHPLPSFSPEQTVLDGGAGVDGVQLVQELHQGQVLCRQGGRRLQLLDDVLLQVAVSRQLGELPQRPPHVQTLTKTHTIIIYIIYISG